MNSFIFRTLPSALRVHQWVKNLLIFLPLVMGHRLLDQVSMLKAAQGFLAFCLCASAVYLFNDVLDREADRAHSSKKKRPIASGAISLPVAYGMIGALLASSVALTWSLSLGFLWCLGIYLILTTLYSLIIKRILAADIVLLASFYAIRILAGGKAADVYVSQWLLAFSMFFFFSLACVKRYSELKTQKLSNEHSRRGYAASDIELISQFGTASGYLSVLVLALYVSSREVMVLYGKPEIIWFCCPLLLYWISRVWLLTHRNLMHEDPIVFALHDRVSYFVGFLGACLLILAI